LAKEVRVFNLQRVVRSGYEHHHAEIDRDEIAMTRTGALLDVAQGVVFGVAVAVGLMAVAALAARGRATPGDVVLTVGMVTRLVGSLTGTISSVGPIRDASIAAYRYHWVERYAREVARHARPTRPSPVPTRVQKGVQLTDVCFTYSGTDRAVLQDVTAFLPAGSTVAFVGENGAGKTTLIKLLARMHLPTSGLIALDGTSLADFDPGAWRQRISAAFQDAVQFETTLREAVAVGDLVGGIELRDDAALVSALDRATGGDLVDLLPSGLATQLGSGFTGGRDLSVGQWQKVALARSVLRPDPLLLVLDEPTSALDPLAEQRLFQGFAHAARDVAARSGAITLLVSHRFSTVRNADRIIVLRGGRVEEAGTHAELVARRGLYGELYELQARAYR
jgi:ATP-binding cassette subfamily B protein